MNVAKSSSGLSFKGVQELLNTSESQHGDLADQADVQTGRVEVAVATINARRASVDPIHMSIFLERIAQGKVDECIDCKGEISPRRRLAMRTAIRCCDCEEAASKKN